jgi:hypothetical protein
MTFEQTLTLSDALRILSETTGASWTRADFFKAVIDQSLPMWATTPSDCWPVTESMGKQHDAGLSSLGYRRYALLSHVAIKNLAMHGEATSCDVALTPGDAEFMPWPAIKARRLMLQHEFEQLPRPLTAQQWEERPANFMGESDVVVLSQRVTVTDDTCRVPTETIQELKVLAPQPVQVSKGSAVTGIKHRMSRNLLDGPIRSAIDRASSSSYQDVWIHLREIAKDGTLPFTGLVEGNKLGFIDDNNKYKTLSKDALRKRLDKYHRPERHPDAVPP